MSRPPYFPPRESNPWHAEGDVAITAAWQEGDALAAEALLQRHIGAISLFADQLDRRLPGTHGMDFEDIRQVAFEETLKLAHRFDPEKSTTGSMLPAMQSAAFPTVEREVWRNYGVQIPDHVSSLSAKLRILERQIFSRHKRWPTDQEAAKNLGVPITAPRPDILTVADVRRVRWLTYYMQNFGTIREVDDDQMDYRELPVQFALMKNMSRAETETPEEIAVKNDMLARASNYAKTKLAGWEHESDIICMTHGIGYERPLGEKEIAERLGISVMSVRKKRAMAHQRLRRWLSDEGYGEHDY